MAEHIPAIQARLIPLGFPRLQEGVTHEVKLAAGVPPSTNVQRRWDFTDREQRTGIVLTESSFVLHTTAYTSVEPFLDRLLRGMEVLRDILNIVLVERLGMRYVDLIRPDPNEPFATYVHRGLLGFPFREAPELEAILGEFATRSVAKTPVGVFVIRSALLPPNQVVPPDLRLGPLQYPQHSASSRPALSIDFDHFTKFSGPGTTPFDFEPQAVIAHMRRLHRTLRAAFDAIATSDAIERWGPWEEVKTS